LKRRRYEKLTLQRKLSKTLQEAKQIAEERLIRVISLILLIGLSVNAVTPYGNGDRNLMKTIVYGHPLNNMKHRKSRHNMIVNCNEKVYPY
jgi:hypothetical protein